MIGMSSLVMTDAPMKMADKCTIPYTMREIKLNERSFEQSLNVRGAVLRICVEAM